MQGYILASIRKFDCALFPESPLRVIVAQNEPLDQSGLRPLVFVEKADNINYPPGVLDKTHLPQDEPFYLLFPKYIEAYNRNNLRLTPGIDPSFTLWTLCINISWHRAQYEQRKKADDHLSTHERWFQLLLSANDLSRCLSPFNQTSPAEFAVHLIESAGHQMSRYLRLFIQGGEDPVIARWRCMRRAECEVIAGSSAWSGTEENIIAFMLRCKEALFKKLETLS